MVSSVIFILPPLWTLLPGAAVPLDSPGPPATSLLVNTCKIVDKLHKVTKICVAYLKSRKYLEEMDSTLL